MVHKTLLDLDKHALSKIDDDLLDTLIRLGDSERGSGYLLLLLMEEQSHREKKHSFSSHPINVALNKETSEKLLDLSRTSQEILYKLHSLEKQMRRGDNGTGPVSV